MAVLKMFYFSRDIFMRERHEILITGHAQLLRAAQLSRLLDYAFSLRFGIASGTPTLL